LKKILVLGKRPGNYLIGTEENMGLFDKLIFMGIILLISF